MQNLNILHEIAFNTSAITDHDMWNSQISVHKQAELEHNLELGLSYSAFSTVFVHSLPHQRPFQMATITVLINLGPWDSLFNCAYARASQLVEEGTCNTHPSLLRHQGTQMSYCAWRALPGIHHPSADTQQGQHFLQGCAWVVQPLCDRGTAPTAPAPGSSRERW